MSKTNLKTYLKNCKNAVEIQPLMDDEIWDTIDDRDVAEVEKPGSKPIPAPFANPKLSQSDIELDLRLQTVPILSPNTATPASPRMFGSQNSLGSLTSLHKSAICDEIDKQSGPLLCKWTSACTLDHHQPAAVTTTRVPRCASTSDVSYARYDGDLINRLLAESEARRATVNNVFINKLRSWLTTDWRALDDRLCGVMENEDLSELTENDFGDIQKQLDKHQNMMVFYIEEIKSELKRRQDIHPKADLHKTQETEKLGADYEASEWESDDEVTAQWEPLNIPVPASPQYDDHTEGGSEWSFITEQPELTTAKIQKKHGLWCRFKSLFKRHK